jgi:ribosomal protein L7Ae-like RNA K-turn-binding protein
VFVSLLAGCVVAPQQRQPLPPPNTVYEEIRRCRSDNQQAHAEVLNTYEAARRAGRINPGEAGQFNAMEARLRNVQIELARDGLSLQECQRIGGAIARERNEVARMTRSDPAAARCMADNRRAHQEVVGLYENAKRSGRINPSEAQRFNAIDARLQNLRADLGRDGIAMQECQRIGGAIARERAEVTRMAQHDPGVARCVADNRRAHEELYKVYNNALRAGRIDAGEAQRFQAIDKRLNGFQAEIKRDGLSLAECQRIGSAIARERALVEKMAR